MKKGPVKGPFIHFGSGGPIAELYANRDSAVPAGLVIGVSGRTRPMKRPVATSSDLGQNMVQNGRFLSASRTPDAPLTVPTLNNLVKDWCRKVNLKGSYGSHTLRKTWGLHAAYKAGHPYFALDASIWT